VSCCETAELCRNYTTLPGGIAKFCDCDHHSGVYWIYGISFSQQNPPRSPRATIALLEAFMKTC